MIDYEVLRFIWWLLIGILLIGFAVADGFDMGVGMLTRFLGRNDTERRIMINAIAPHWDGNQVWLITAGGALFAAWPMVYAAAFSGFYVAMIPCWRLYSSVRWVSTTARRLRTTAGVTCGTGASSLAASCRRW